jgi:1,6-anhydro-N-acetylmuramate kinase
MTGTSLDGIDAALVQITGAGPSLTASVLNHASGPFGPARDTLAALCRGEPATAADIAAARRELADQTAAVMRRAADGASLQFAAVHGQTVYHSPPDSWQMIDAARVAHALGCPTAFDLRGGDVAAGGQGAPVTPLADLVLFGGGPPRAVVNLGGFCNITWLPGDGDVRGRDICPCNHLLDAAARMRLGRPYDEDGRIAGSGQVDDTLLATLTQTLHTQFHGGERSLGTGDECVQWIEHHASTDTPTLLATLAAAIGTFIGTASRHANPHELLIAGGGAHHQPLLAAITSAADRPTMLTAARGVPIEAREAACVAVLAAIDGGGEPTTLPEVTGRRPGPCTSMSWCRPLPDS